MVIGAAFVADWRDFTMELCMFLGAVSFVELAAALAGKLESRESSDLRRRLVP
jgi:hypothetical protein